MPLEMGKGLCGTRGAGIQHCPFPHPLPIILTFTKYPCGSLCVLPHVGPCWGH